MTRSLRDVAISCLCAVLAVFGAVRAASAQQWQQTDGAANDVGVGANGAVWVVGTDAVEGGYRIWRRDGATWKATQAAGVRIAVGPNGEAWIVNDEKEIFRVSADGARVTPVPGRKARDIGVGADGTVWIIGDKAEAGGYGIYRSSNGAQWKKIAGSAMRISVDPSGNAWVVNNTAKIFRHDGTSFVQLPGAATDVGIGADGAAWVIGTDGGIYRFEGTNWAKKTGGAAQIAAGASGAVWAVNAHGAIYQAQLAPYNPLAPIPIPSGAVTVNVPPPAPVVVQPPTLMAVTPPSAPTQPALVQVPGQVVTLPGTTQAAPIDPENPWRVFPRGGQYEAKILQAIRFQDFANRVFPGGQVPAASTLTPLERAFADIALSATEAHFAARPLSAEEEIALVRSDAIVRGSVTTLVGLGVSGRVREARRDADTVALRQWAAEVYRNFKIDVAKATLDQYRLWARDPCGYEKLPAVRCQGSSGMLSPPRPSQEVIASNALGAVLSSHADETAAATAVGLAVATMGASAAALATGLGVAAGTVSVGGAYAPITVAVSTSLYAAFGATTTTITTATTGAVTTALPQAAAVIGAASWAGVVAAPVTAAILVVVVGTIEGVAVVEGVRVEPMLKLKVGAAMTDTIVIENELQEEHAGDFFLLAYQSAAARGFYVPMSKVDGEVRYFCQAGYVCRFKLGYSQNGAAKSFQTPDLPVGREQSYVIPYNATGITASGEWFNGSSWNSLFTRNVAKPTYIGFTAYGTVFKPEYKDEYPEISNIQAPPNQLIVTQGGGYVAWIRVSYTENGVSSRVVDVNNASAGWRQAVTIPKDATNIHLEAWSNTGWVGEPWKTIIDKTWPVPPNVCIKTYNTTLDPKWNNECN